jgi:hypothetical protein
MVVVLTSLLVYKKGKTRHSNWRVSLLEIPKPYFTASLVEEQNSENVFMSSLSHGRKC